MSKQVFDGPDYCTCRVARTRDGGAEIITEPCELHGPGLPADALVSALPLKSDVERKRMFEDAADSLLKPRQIFTHHPIDTPEAKDLFGGRMKRARG